jgi:hypothetical protein
MSHLHLRDASLEDPGVLKWIFEWLDFGGGRGAGGGSIDCIDVAHDRERWLALVNALMNLRVS